MDIELEERQFRVLQEHITKLKTKRDGDIPNSVTVPLVSDADKVFNEMQIASNALIRLREGEGDEHLMEEGEPSDTQSHVEPHGEVYSQNPRSWLEGGLTLILFLL